MRPIKVGFDAQSLTGKFQTGLGIYAKNLARILEKHPQSIDLKLLWPPDHKPFSKTMERLRWEQYKLIFEANREEVELIHIPCFSVPINSKIPKIVTAHDMIVRQHPNLMAPGSRWYFSKWIPYTYKFADHIIAVSQATKNDLVNLLKIDPGKITVIHHGSNPAYIRTTDPHEINRIRFNYHCPMEYFVMLGSFEPRKNIELAIDAFAKILKFSPQLRLILIGKPNEYRNAMQKKVRDMKLSEQVIFAGYAPDKEIATLMSVATAFLFPSKAEGFGLPMIEAMATGCPVIASGLQVFHEVGGDAASYVPVDDVDALADRMKKFIGDPEFRVDYVRKALARSAAFDWEKAADKTVEVYRMVLSRKGIDLQE
jgi:glycosyltransferase involved in cell wall biosynthesis